jgi:cell division protein FtsB
MAYLRPKMVMGVTGVVALVVLLSLVQEMNRRIQIQREVRALEQEVDSMQRTITQLENLNQYFRTDDYQERLAREKLSYQAFGEKVVLIPDEGGRRRKRARSQPSESYRFLRNGGAFSLYRNKNKEF